MGKDDPLHWERVGSDMKLQGAIFDFQDTLLDESGAPLPGVDRFLFLMKLEDVWMYLVTDDDRPGAQKALEQAGLASYFRGFVSAAEHNSQVGELEFMKKVLRRLRTSPRATPIFTARESVLRAMKAEGAQVILIGEGHSEELKSLADEVISDYREMSQLP